MSYSPLSRIFLGPCYEQPRTGFEDVAVATISKKRPFVAATKSWAGVAKGRSSTSNTIDGKDGHIISTEGISTSGVDGYTSTAGGDGGESPLSDPVGGGGNEHKAQPGVLTGSSVNRSIKGVGNGVMGEKEVDNSTERGTLGGDDPEFGRGEEDCPIPEVALPRALWHGHTGAVARIGSCSQPPCFFSLGEVSTYIYMYIFKCIFLNMATTLLMSGEVLMLVKAMDGCIEVVAISSSWKKSKCVMVLARIP